MSAGGAREAAIRIVAMVSCIVLVAGCGATQSSKVSTVCDNSLSDCGDGCEIDLLTDSRHCGRCDQGCAEGEACIDGRCDDEIEFASSERHSCSLRVDGSVACRGINEYGQLGEGTTRDRNEGVTVVGLDDVVEITVGDDHSCARRGSGEVFCWGRNHLGQLGDGTATDTSTARPVPVIGLFDAEELAAVEHRTCARRATGQVVCWGATAAEAARGEYHELPTLVSEPLPLSDIESRPAPSVPTEDREATVELTVYGMSKCRYFNKALPAVLAVSKALHPELQLRVEYIGRNEKGRLSSMHGEPEVQGDMIQLCVRQHSGYVGWLDFLQCQSETVRQIPGNWEACARQNNVDLGRVRSCFEQGEGRQLLEASFQASTKAGARGSPTIFVDSQRYSGGRQESDFAAAICPLINDRHPTYCGHFPQHLPILITLLSDSRCTRPECDVAAKIRLIKSKVRGARIAREVFGTPRGLELYKKTGSALLPALVVNAEAASAVNGFSALKGFKSVGDIEVKSLGRFDPTKSEWVPRPKVPVRFLVDGRCKTRECEGATRFESFIKRQIPKSQIVHVDYDTDEGRALWLQFAATSAASKTSARDRAPGLPVVFFGKALQIEEEAFAKLERRLKTIGNEYSFQLGDWDPTAEICDNGVDDDGDRRVDCRDPGCRESLLCRPEKRRRLDIFVMSQCPYGAKVLKATQAVLGHFGRRRNKIDINIQFVGRVESSGELSSMHGQSEIDDDLRMICAQRYYGRQYTFLDFVTCRQQTFRETTWEQCVKAPMKVDVIRRCAEGDEGARLLRKSFDLAGTLEFRGSPSILLNNQHVIRARTSQALVDSFCERNKLPECSTPLSVF